MSETPMTDLYETIFPGYGYDIDFVSQHGSDVYHALEFCADWRERSGIQSFWKDGKYHALCSRLTPIGLPLHGTIAAYNEEDISPVRTACGLCLRVLRQAIREKVADETPST